MNANIIKCPSDSINCVINCATKHKLATFVIASTSIYVVYYFYYNSSIQSNLTSNCKDSSKKG